MNSLKIATFHLLTRLLSLFKNEFDFPAVRFLSKLQFELTRALEFEQQGLQNHLVYPRIAINSKSFICGEKMRAKSPHFNFAHIQRITIILKHFKASHLMYCFVVIRHFEDMFSNNNSSAII